MGNAVAARRAAQPPVPGQALRILKDEKLAAMVGAGSDDAFAVLYRRHHQAVYRYCLSLLRQEADARDALQSTMLAALSSLRAHPIEGVFKPWLFRIAHNEAISIIRGRTREAPEEAAPPALVADDPEAREQFQTLVSDLGALPERQRGAIVMRELSGLSYAQIAAALETSEAGGKQLVYEARSALHELRAGHEMSCELVRERISANDRRLLRGRKVRAHLRGCEPCQDFEQAIRRRRTALAAFAPPIAPLAAAAILQDVFSSGGGVGGAGGAGAATATGFTSGGFPLAGPAALKAIAAAAVTAAAGVGAYAAGNAVFSDDPAATTAAQVEPHASAKPADHAETQAGHSGGSHAAFARAGDGAANGDARAGTTAGATDPPGSGAGDSGVPGENSPDATAPSGAAPGASGDSGAAGSNGGDSPAGGGDSADGGGDQSGSSPTSPPGSGSSDPPASPPSSDPPVNPPPSGGGSGDVAPGTPAGHGGTPPGQGGSPPGLSSGPTPPGHLGNPGRGGSRAAGRGHGHR